jgi:hypothetical protein
MITVTASRGVNTMRNLFLILSLSVCLSFCSCVETPDNWVDVKPDYEKAYRDNERLDVPYTRVPGHVPDPTKTKGTSTMCWAMVACSQLVYAGFVQDEMVCINNLGEEFGNEPGSLGQAFEFYFKEYLQIKWSTPEAFTWTKGPEDDDIISFIMNNIDDGRPVALSLRQIDGQKYGHVVLVFGYSLNFYGDEIDLYLVDGDDGKHTAWMTLTFDGEYWPITGGVIYKRFELGYVLALEPATD